MRRSIDGHHLGIRPTTPVNRQALSSAGKSHALEPDPFLLYLEITLSVWLICFILSGLDLTNHKRVK